MAAEPLTEQAIDEMLNLVIRGTKKVPAPDSSWLAGHEVMWFRGEGDATEEGYFNLRSGEVIAVGPGSREVIDALALALLRHLDLRESANANLVRVEILVAVGSVLTGTRKMKGLGATLLERLAKRMARSVTVYPVAGLAFSGDNPGTPITLGDRLVIGPLRDATEEAVNDFSKKFVDHPLALTRDAWWTEDLYGFRADPKGYDDTHPLQHVAVIAVGLDVVGTAAAIRGKELVEALLGALWLTVANSSDYGPPQPPWMLGGPNRVDTPRDPDFDYEPGLSMVALQASTGSSSTEALPIEARYEPLDVLEALGNGNGLIELVGGAESPAPGQTIARRVAAACRFAWISAQDTSDDLQLLHLVIALEALISDHGPGSGVTSRFVTRLLTLQPPAQRAPARLEALYNLRSEVGHQGFSAESRTQLANATAYATELLVQCLHGYVETVKVHGFRDETKLLAWLDRSAPDLTDPFA